MAALGGLWVVVFTLTAHPHRQNGAGGVLRQTLVDLRALAQNALGVRQNTQPRGRAVGHSAHARELHRAVVLRLRDWASGTHSLETPTLAHTPNPNLNPNVSPNTHLFLLALTAPSPPIPQIQSELTTPSPPTPTNTVSTHRPVTPHAPNTVSNVWRQACTA